MITTNTLPPADLEKLISAKKILDNPGLAAKITNYIGMPIEKGLELLPEDWSAMIGEITHSALLKATEAALFTLKDRPGTKSSNVLHKLSVAATGGAGGFFGLPGLAVELPVSTTIMLRSIADVGRAEGESLENLETKLACLEVLSLGGNNTSDDSSDSGYYATRALLARSVAESMEFLASRGLTEEGTPILLRLLQKIGQRFNIQISEKAAAQALPVIGAAGGALINTLFMDHFQDMAKGHFTIRKLERIHGKEVIEEMYKQLPD